ncbi:MAG: MerR family transcriptional regulator [Alphaproteobacteria bacterium]|nr:MerR family transcriptional regulator [Alphaproteobacteria bacterium]
MNRQLSPQEVASRFGVSIKALRLYERHGLLAPLRSEAGWRTYGSDQIARLHQVLALKRLGLPLARIAQLLGGRDELDRVLALQEEVLVRQTQVTSRALELIRTARSKLAAGQTLSIDDLANLNMETVMTTKPDPEELKTLFSAFADKHFTADERAQMHAKMEDRKYDQQEITARWDALIAEAKTVMAAGDPASPAAQDLARRWRAQVLAFTGGDPELAAKVRAFWNDALKDQKMASATPLTPDLMAFMGRAMAGLQAS